MRTKEGGEAAWREIRITERNEVHMLLHIQTLALAIFRVGTASFGSLEVNTIPYR